MISLFLINLNIGSAAPQNILQHPSCLAHNLPSGARHNLSSSTGQRLLESAPELDLTLLGLVPIGLVSSGLQPPLGSASAQKVAVRRTSTQDLETDNPETDDRHTGTRDGPPLKARRTAFTAFCLVNGLAAQDI
jgi:hypothetical protein